MGFLAIGGVRAALTNSARTLVMLTRRLRASARTRFAVARGRNAEAIFAEGHFGIFVIVPLLRNRKTMAGQRTRRMHTVPRSYLETFAVQDPDRRTPSVWRFDRLSAEAKVVGVRDAEVVKDIYALVDDTGSPDTVIEDAILGEAEVRSAVPEISSALVSNSSTTTGAGSRDSSRFSYSARPECWKGLVRSPPRGPAPTGRAPASHADSDGPLDSPNRSDERRHHLRRN